MSTPIACLLTFSSRCGWTPPASGCTLLFFLVVVSIAAPRIEAQQCYVRTDDWGHGNFLVKAVSDSTCFGLWYDTLYYQNYRNQEVYYAFHTMDYFGLPATGTIDVTDILLYDSILVVSWEGGWVFRFLKVEKNGDIAEIPSPLDQMPMLKFSLDGDRYIEKRRIVKVNDSVLLMSTASNLYSFRISGDSIACMDSMRTRYGRLWDPFDTSGDTVIVLSLEEAKQARFYRITETGTFLFMDSMQVSGAKEILDREVNIRYGHGNIYLWYDSGYSVLLRTDSGFVYKKGSLYANPYPPLLLPGGIAQLGMFYWEEMVIYTPELDTICIKPATTDRTVCSVSNFGDKIFIGRSDGITTWIPDTTTLSSVDAWGGKYIDGVNIWPNPIRGGLINVASTNGISRIVVTNVHGKVFHIASGDLQETVTVTPHGLTPGVYFVNVTLSDSIIRKRIVVLAD